jgi:hypothetical protein
MDFFFSEFFKVVFSVKYVVFLNICAMFVLRHFDGVFSSLSIIGVFVYTWIRVLKEYKEYKQNKR